ncbi:MAG: NAD-dependent epimerase/dehydratase family protein [Phycisphaerales bacterium JB039]
MPASRRDFIRFSAAAGAATIASLASAEARAAGLTAPLRRQHGQAEKKLKILILGGTGFLGPHTVRAALARGHEMTLFNRGRTEQRTGHTFPDLESLRGNRDPKLRADADDPESPQGLTELEGRSWDAVIDTSGYVPRIVKASAELLSPSVKQYVFISSISVYAAHDTPGADETAPVGTMEDPTVEEMGESFQNYGPLKALCEQAAEAAMPGRVTNIRPGLIVGPGDPTDRFTYWPVRVRKGGEVLAPGAPGDLTQFIDVRDLADFIIRTLEDNTTGVFNATGPASPMPIGDLLGACKKVSGSDAEFIWGDLAFLREHNINGWSDLPVWLPNEGETAGFGQRSIERAVRAGLSFLPASETIRDTLEWWDTLPGTRTASLRAGLAEAREAAALEAWHKAYG